MDQVPTPPPPPAPRPPIVILCDGTWCGRETGTQTNVYRLAKLFGLFGVNTCTDNQTWQTSVFRLTTNIKRLFGFDPDNSDREDAQSIGPDPADPNGPQIYARYRHGVGLGGSFLDYLSNGATAQDLTEEVKAAYRFIVDHYQPGSKIWLFGLSRGAYTVRCVAGMINNCGIISLGTHTREEIDRLCDEAYRIYKSSNELNRPHSLQSQNFRRQNSWPLIGDDSDEIPPEAPLQPPVRFMGLFDTVGSLGIPTLSGSDGFEWPRFHDDEVSSVVQDVYHLVSLHDRFYAFQPCLTTRQRPGGPVIDEEWIPGAHYDLGRQRFRFWRTGAGPVDTLGALASKIPILGGKTITPNHVLSDLAMWKMLQQIRRIQIHDQNGSTIPAATLDNEIARLAACIHITNQDDGDGDVYQNIVQYGPFGIFLGRTIQSIAGKLDIWNTFFELRDRFIPNDNANVYPFKRVDAVLRGNRLTVQSVGDLGRVTAKRYPSKTAESWAERQKKQWP